MKKVAIVAYYWPPSGGPGVQRVLKFAKYLPQFGWEPIIITVKDGEYPAIDHSLLNDVPSNLRVYHVPSFEFFQLFRLLTGRKSNSKLDTFELVKKKTELKISERIFQFIRNNLFIPDARIGWYLRGRRNALKIIRSEKPDIIFSSSPPHSLQILSKWIAKKTNIPWVADFRDPWTKSFYDKGINRLKIAEGVNRRLEHAVIKSADHVVSVSQGVLELLGVKTNNNMSVIPNGFDRDDFQIRKRNSNSKFQIVYTGHVASTQHPELFFKAIHELPDALKEKLEINFYGSVDPLVRKQVHELGLAQKILFHSYISHDKVIEILVASDLLLLLIPKTNAKGILTGKLFEYLASGNRILGIGDKDGVAAQVIKKCEAGKMVGYEEDPSQILVKHMIDWQNNIDFKPNESEVNKYNRKSLTKELSSIFDKLCS